MALNKMILGNWKMNKTFEEIETFCHVFNKLIKSDKILKKTNTLIGIAPTFMGIPPLASNINPNIKVMAQNCSAKDNGAYTSEVSYRMLKELNVNYVLLGHSEVRAHLSENDQMINEKVKTLLNQGMHAILCIGETLKEFETKKTTTVLTKQLKADLADVDSSKVEYLTIAYEPIWAIGTGKTATNEIIASVFKTINKVLKDILKDNAVKVHVLYGGSANENNAADIMAINGVDGVLVGGASLDPQKFYTIAKATPEYLRAKVL